MRRVEIKLRFLDLFWVTKEESLVIGQRIELVIAMVEVIPELLFITSSLILSDITKYL
jgi:hypothetical protein